MYSRITMYRIFLSRHLENYIYTIILHVLTIMPVWKWIIRWLNVTSAFVFFAAADVVVVVHIGGILITLVTDMDKKRLFFISLSLSLTRLLYSIVSAAHCISTIIITIPLMNLFKRGGNI